MTNEVYEMQKAFATILLQQEGQRVTKFANNDVWLDGELVCKNGEVIQ